MGPLDGKMYRLCNDQDIFAGLVDDADLKQVIIEQPSRRNNPEPQRILTAKGAV